MGYKEEVAGRIYEAFERRKHAARLKRERYNQVTFAEGVTAILRRDGRIPDGEKDIHQTTASRWMVKGDPSSPDNPTLMAIAEELGVTFLWLTTGAEMKTPPEEGALEKRKAKRVGGQRGEEDVG